MPTSVSQAEVALDRDIFLRNLIRDLSGTLEEVVGLSAAEGYISSVGGSIGNWIGDAYLQALDARQLSPQQVAEVCIDLKRRIGGDFHLIAVEEDRLVFGNSRCPFGAAVRDRPSLCMMTSNVFGRIAANNLGYARVALDETIARGAAGCTVTVHLRPAEGATPGEREYFRPFDPALDPEAAGSHTPASPAPGYSAEPADPDAPPASPRDRQS